MSITNLVIYTPEAVPKGFPSNTLFLKSDTGLDWYEYLSQVVVDETFTYLQVTKEGIVTSHTTDPSGLFPIDQSVYKCVTTDLPSSGPNENNWLYLDGVISIAAPDVAVELNDALNTLVYDFGDGRIIQVRPDDEPNFERAYKIFALTGLPSMAWVMADNVKHQVTEAELREAHNYGLLAGAALWDAYQPS